MPLPNPGPGRPKGSRSKQQLQVEAILQRLDCCPIEGMAMIMMQKCPCPTCDGALQARYSIGQFGIYIDPDKGETMTCRTCWGTGREPISPELRGKMASELAQYIAPKRKSIEHTVQGDAPLFVILGAQPDETAKEWERRNNPDIGKLQ